MIEDKALSQPLDERYAGWDIGRRPRRCSRGEYSLEEIAELGREARTSTRSRSPASRNCWRTSSTATSERLPIKAD